MGILLMLVDNTEAQVTAYLLSSLDSHIVRVNTLVEVEQHVAERDWALLILDDDILQPDTKQLLRALLATDFAGSVLVLGSLSNVTNKIRALEQGADDYLSRPYEPAELMARARVAVRRARQRTLQPSAEARDDIIVVGRVVLNVHDLTVAVPGRRPQRLTPTEMRLLRHLMLQAPRLVKQQELLTQIFGDNTMYLSSNAVTVYMSRLRQKIEHDPERPRYIITMRGSGYKFSADELAITSLPPVVDHDTPRST